MKDRVETLEEVILGLEVNPEAGPQTKAIQQKLTSQLKRDSMVAASHLSQKIKSTYRLKTSGKIFNKVHSNVRSDLLGKYELHRDGVWFITASHRYNRLLIATASADGTAAITDMSSPGATANPVATYSGHQGCSVNCVRFHPKNDLLITASGDGGAHVWRVNFDQIFSVSENEEKDSPDDGIMIKQPNLELTGHTSVVSSCDWMSTNDQCVTSSWDRTANLYDLNTGELVVQLIGHDQELTDVAAHPSSPLIVTSSHDTTFRLWDFREAIHSVCVFQGHSDRVNSTVFLGQDKVVSGSDDRTAKVWDLKNMRSPLANIHVESAINKLGVNSQGNMLAIPLENRTARIYDSNGSRLCRLSRSHHERMVTCAAFAPVTLNTSSPSPAPNFTGQLFTCGFDRRVCWWSLSPEKNEKIKD